MKKLIFKLLALTLVVSFSSCNEDYKDENDDTLSDRTSVAYFTETSSTLYVYDDSVGTVDINISVSEAKPYDRSFEVSIQEASTAEVGLDYQELAAPSTLLIPANKQFGSFTVTAGDYNNATVAGVNLIFNLVEVQDANLDYRLTHNLKILRFCPINAPFTGEYLLEELTTPGADGVVLDSGSIVTVYNIAGSETKRGFMTNNFPAFCTTPNQFIIDFVCGEVLMPGNGNTSNCICEQGVPYYFATPPVPETFNPDDDSEFLMTFINDSTENCGPPVLTTYKLTKQ